MLVGEAAGYRGARVSGIPFTSERQLTGGGPAEATATIVHRVLAELGLDGHRPAVERRSDASWHCVDEPASRRAPKSTPSLPFLEELTRGRHAVAVGRVAHAVLGGPYVRHPAHGGARAFRAGLIESLR